MANDSKNIKFNIQTKYGYSNEQTKNLTQQIKTLAKALKDLRQEADKEINIRGSSSSFKAMQSNIDSALSQLDKLQAKYKDIGASRGELFGKDINIKELQSINAVLTEQRNLYNSMVSSQQKATKVPSIDNAELKSDNLSKYSEKIARVSTQINDMRNAMAVSLANAGGNVKDPAFMKISDEYAPKIIALRGYLSDVDKATKKVINSTEGWNEAMKRFSNRMGWMFTRFVAGFATGVMTHFVEELSHVEQGMANFNQVANHSWADVNKNVKIYKEDGLKGLLDAYEKGSVEVNNFNKALDEITTTDLYEHTGITHEKSEAFKEELRTVQTELFNLAKAYGTTMEEMQESATLWGRAYKNVDEVMAMTKAATMLAIADNFDIVSANKALESSVMQWGFQIESAVEAQAVAGKIIDSWTAIAHNYTVSAQTMAEANKRMAQSAREVGVSFDVAQATIAVMARYTQADGGEIGNALKSIFGSIHSNKSIKALEDFGVSVYKIGNDGSKELRKVDDVLMDIMIKAEGSKENMETLLKSISGGKWQWNKASAMLNINEFLDVLRMSQESRGFTEEQVGAQLDTINRKLQTFQTTLQQVMQGDGNIAGMIKDGLDAITKLLEFLNSVPAAAMKVAFGFATVTQGVRILTGKTIDLDTIIKNTFTKGKVVADNYNRSLVTVSGSTATVATATGQMQGSLSGVTTATRKFDGALSSLKTAVGGWVGIALIATGIAYDLYKSFTQIGKSELGQLESKNQHLEMLQEQITRMEEATGLISTYSNAVIELTKREGELTSGSQEQISVHDAKEKAIEGLIEVIGKEGYAELEAAGFTEDAVNRQLEAHKQKIKGVQNAAEIERHEMNEISKKVKSMVDEQITSMTKSNQGWWENIKAMIAAGEAVKVLTNSYHFLSRAIHEWRAESAQAELESGKNSLGEELSESEKKYLNDKIYYHNQAANFEQKTIDNNNMEVAMSSVRDSIEALKSLQSVNSGDFSTEAPVPKTGLSDTDEETSNKKNAKRSKKEEYSPDSNAEIVTKILMSEGGFTLEEASATVGNFMTESGGNTENLNGGIENGIGAYGIAQWLDGRKDSLLSWLQANGYAVDSVEGQARFWLHEINSSPYENAQWRQSQASYDGTVESLAYAIQMNNERAGRDGSESSRQANARALYERLKAKEGFDSWDGKGSFVKQKDNSQKLADNINKIIDSIVKHVENSSKVIEERYNHFDSIINTQEDLYGATSATQAQHLSYSLNKKNDVAQVNTEYKKQYTAWLDKFTDVEKKVLEENTNKSFEELVKLSSAEIVKAVEKIPEEGNRVLLAKTNGLVKLQEAYQKSTDELSKYDTEIIKHRRLLAEMVIGERRSELANMQRDVEFELAMSGKSENHDDIFKRQQEYILANIRLEKELLEIMESEQYPLEKIEEQRKKVQDLTLKAREDELKLKDSINRGWHDMANDLLVQGSSIKDIWKKLWQDLANEALKMLFRIEDGNHSLLGNLLRRRDNGKSGAIQSERTGENPIGSFWNMAKGRGIYQGVFANKIDKNTLAEFSDLNYSTMTLESTTKQLITTNESLISVLSVQGGQALTLGSSATDAGRAVRGLSGLFKGRGGFNWTELLGLLHFADGGFIDEEQIAHVGEGGKREVVIPVEKNDNRAKSLLIQAGAEMGMIKTGVMPEFKDKSFAKTGVKSTYQVAQNRMIDMMADQNMRTNNALNLIANNTENQSSTIAQPIMMKQTMTDNELLASFMRLKRNGKLR